MAVKKFEDLIVWQKAQDFAVNIYSSFEHCRDFGFKDQITRATVSISNNIAEGFDRSSNLDFSRYLYIALSSNSEVRSMLYLAKRLNYLEDDTARLYINHSNEIGRMIFGLIKSLKTSS